MTLQRSAGLLLPVVYLLVMGCATLGEEDPGTPKEISRSRFQEPGYEAFQLAEPPLKEPAGQLLTLYDLPPDPAEETGGLRDFMILHPETPPLRPLPQSSPAEKAGGSAGSARQAPPQREVEPAPPLPPAKNPSAEPPSPASPEESQSGSPAAEGEKLPAEEILCRPDDLIRIRLEGTGWLYLEEPTDSEILQFEDRRYRPGGMDVIFRALMAGEEDLLFQKQRLGQGEPLYQRYLLRVQTDAVRSSASSEAAPSADEDLPEGEGPSAGEGLPGEGLPGEEGDSDSQDWRRAFLEGRLDLDARELTQKMGWFPVWEEGLKEGRDEEMEIPEILYVNRETLSEDVELLLLYLQRHPFEADGDYLYYHLGMLFAFHSDLRDADKAFWAFSRVIEGYPLSLYWKKARDARNYMERHFYDIR